MSGEKGLQVLCFRVGQRTFAFDIMGIREILRNQKVTPVPHTPRHVAGVLNLRGALIPVVDLQAVLLGMPGPAAAEDPKLIVVQARGRTAGLLVDQVLDVVAVRSDTLAPVPGAHVDGGSVVVATFHRSAGGEDEVVVLIRLGPLVEGEVVPSPPEGLLQ